MRDEEHIEKAFDFGRHARAQRRSSGRDGRARLHRRRGRFFGRAQFFVAYGIRPTPAELARELGRALQIMNADIKRWAVGSHDPGPR